MVWNIGRAFSSSNCQCVEEHKSCFVMLFVKVNNDCFVFPHQLST